MPVLHAVFKLAVFLLAHAADFIGEVRSASKVRTIAHVPRIGQPAHTKGREDEVKEQYDEQQRPCKKDERAQ